MSLLTEEEKNALSIRRMIFHVVGKSLVEPTLLEEITPPEHTDFFLERVKSVLCSRRTKGGYYLFNAFLRL